MMGFLVLIVIGFVPILLFCYAAMRIMLLSWLIDNYPKIKYFKALKKIEDIGSLNLYILKESYSLIKLDKYRSIFVFQRLFNVGAASILFVIFVFIYICLVSLIPGYHFLRTIELTYQTVLLSFCGIYILIWVCELQMSFFYFDSIYMEIKSVNEN